MIQSLLNKLKCPLDHGDLDSPALTIQRVKLIQSKPFLLKLYSQWYRQIAVALPEGVSGPILELGSGAGFLHKFIPGLITSELLDTGQVDITLDGCRLPFKDNSLRAVVMVDVFHHLADAGRFLKDSARCVQSGGRIIMIEPWMTPWSQLIYHHLHHEPVDMETQTWRLPVGGPLSNANTALPWIVFNRDHNKFKEKFPGWHLKKILLHTPFRYLLSGGLSFRSFAPGILFESIDRLEISLKPFLGRIAMFATILLEKKSL